MREKKIKVVWLCAFTNNEIAQKIGVVNNVIVAPWLTELINLFRSKNDIKLYIVSPNYYTNTPLHIFFENINLFLFKYRPNYIPKKAYNVTYHYKTTQRSVEKIVNQIHPDMIHLLGSENPLYGAGILSLKNRYPVLVTLQGFIKLSSVPKNIISKYIRWNRCRIERLINTNEKYFGCATEDTKKVLQEINPNSIKFDTYYPTSVPEISALDFPIKKYDLVYFTRITKDKGIEDFIEAVYQIKQTYINISAIIVGGGNANYVSALKAALNKKKLGENITFAGYQSNQQEVFKLAAQAKVYVLPTYFDGIPGSIREAMYMQLPIVAYNVGGIPTFNDQAECITLAEKGNISDLITKINLVLNDHERTQRLVSNAFNMIKTRFDNNKIYNNWIEIYYKILNNQYV